MEELYLFILCFLLVFVVYYLFFIRRYREKKVNKNKKSRRKKVIDKKDKRPMEVNYLLFKYKLNLDKVNYNKLLLVVAIVSSIDISVVVSLVMLIDNYFGQILIAMLSIIPVIMISYHIVGVVYRRGGYCNE